MKYFMIIFVMTSLAAGVAMGKKSQDSFSRKDFGPNQIYNYERLIELTVAVEQNRDVIQELRASLIAVGERAERAEAQIAAIADKLDDDDVLLMDTDYRAVIDAL